MLYFIYFFIAHSLFLRITFRYRFYVPKTTRLKHALKSWPEFKPPKEDSESEEEETVLSASQSVIKYLWNSVTLEPDSEHKVKVI